MTIARTKLADRVLPNYTRGNEIFNMLSHVVGIIFAFYAVNACLYVSLTKGDGWGVLSSGVYGLSMILLYTMSSIYHGLTHLMAKKVMQIMDHCTIFLLIAGTYTPVCLVALRPVYPQAAWTLFGIVWGLSIIGIILNAIDLRRYRVFSMICYLGLGWSVIFFFRQTIAVVPYEGILFLVWGGIAYTLGAILYGIGSKKPWMHGVFHIFVLLGTVLQFVCILSYVLQ